MKYFLLAALLLTATPALAQDDVDAYDNGYNSNSVVPPEGYSEDQSYAWRTGNLDAQEDDDKAYQQEQKELQQDATPDQ
jgi:hypothetical protein